MPTPLLSLSLLLSLGLHDDDPNLDLRFAAPPEASTQPADADEEGEPAPDDPADGDDEPADAVEDPADGADEPVDAANEPADAADEPADAASSSAEAAAEGPAEDPEDLDLDDIFGDPEDHDIPEISDAGGGGDGSVAPVKAPSKWDALDARLRVVSSIYMDVDGPLPTPSARRFDPGYGGRGNFSRHETRIEFFASYTPNEHISIVADIEPVFLEFPEPENLEGLTDRFQLAPFHVESDAAYVHLVDVLPGLDFKFGRQIVVWGTADKFNPTNNLNADDLEDRPLFTEPIANQMAVFEFNPWEDKVWFQGVYVPWFVPALLPPSGSLALQDSQTDAPYADQADRDAIDFLQSFVLANPQFDPSITARVNVPNRKFTNGQAAFKIGSTLGPVDMSASYFYGFHDIPMPEDVSVEQVADLDDPADPVTGAWYTSEVSLIYPRMHVVGLDFATQLGFLDNAGLWGEGALIIPARDYSLRTETPVPLAIPDYGDGGLTTEIIGNTVRSRNGKALPYIKATAGADYTIGKHVYLQAQYLRGMIDQFGGGENMGNFLVAGGDLVFFGRHLVFRTFAVTEFPELGEKDDVPSVAIAPNLIMVPPWGFLTFELGGFALIGRRDTYFGAPYTGTSIAYFKATGQF